MQETKSEKYLEIREDLKNYLSTRFELLKLDASEKAAKWLSALVAQLLSLTFILLFLVFGSLAIALYLGELLGSNAKGFAIVAGSCLLIALLIYLLKNRFLKHKLTNLFIHELLKEDETSND